MAASAVSLQPLSGSSGSGLGGSLSSRVGNHKDYRIYRSTPLSEPLRGIPPLARPVDASYYTPVTTKSPSPPTSSTSSTSSSIFYRQRSESFENMLLAPSSRASFSYSSSSHSGKPVLEPETPFDAHLQAVYSGAYDMAEGLAFFESHGYYDVDDANTVAMFRQNFGLTDLFWDKNSAAAATADSAPVLVLDADSSDALGFPSVGTTLYRRHRSVSGRFELVDSDGNAVDDELERERAREARLKSLALELDEFDLRELAHEQAVLVHAISAIRSETLQFQQYFSEAFREADAATVVQCAPAPPVQHARHATLPSCATAVPMPAVAVAAAAPPPPSGVMTPSEVATAVASAASALSPPPQLAGLQQLPPYCGNVFLLKDTIPYLLRSWRKRWFYLDFNAGLLMMYKRSYWKSPRGVLDLRTVTKVERMNHSGDFRLEFHSAQQPVMLLRTKAAEEAELWVNLLRFAKHHVGATPAPQLVLDVAAGDMRAHVLLENKLKKQAGAAPRRASNKPANQGEMVAMLPNASATPAASASAPAMSSSSSSSRAPSAAPAPSSSSSASASRRRASRNNVSSA